MAGLTFQIDDSRAVARLRFVERAAANPRPAYQAVGRALVNRIRLCFRMGVDPWGSRWTALRIRQGQPLRDTGRLMNSIVANPDATGVTVGTNLRQARLQQFGGVVQARPGKTLAFPGPNGMIFAKRVSIPGRAFMPLTRPDGPARLPVPWALDVVRSLRQYFQNAARGR